MTTVLSVYNSEGCVGRCDARCHEATSPPLSCDCICGGAYHGCGAQNAPAIATERVDPEGELRRRFAEAHGFDPAELRLEAGQTPLFAESKAYGARPGAGPTERRRRSGNQGGTQ